jgi:hypothetical protein
MFKCGFVLSNFAFAILDLLAAELKAACIR